MPELLTLQDLANGHLDVKALGEAANGDENTIVTTRTGNTYPSAERAINIMFQNGGLPAKPFPTKARMETDGASLADDSYAMVTNEKGVDAINNGLYTKAAGAWVKSAYDPTALANEHTDNKAKLKPSVFDSKQELLLESTVTDTSAIVVNDGSNNGFYKKSGGQWVKTQYNPKDEIYAIAAFSDTNTTDVIRADDASGQSVYRATTNGEHYFVNIENDLKTELSLKTEYSELSSKSIFEHKDSAGIVTLKQTTDGDLHAVKLGNVTKNILDINTAITELRDNGAYSAESDTLGAYLAGKYYDRNHVSRTNTTNKIGFIATPADIHALSIYDYTVSVLRIPSLLRLAKNQYLVGFESRVNWADVGQNSATSCIVTVDEVTHDVSVSNISSIGHYYIDEFGKWRSYMNPAFVCLNDSLTVFTFYLRRHERKEHQLYMRKSTDGGKTWGQENDMSHIYKSKYDWAFLACNSNGFVKKYGKHKGRLVVPAFHSDSRYSSEYINVNFIYSDDNGETWDVGADTPWTLTSEAQLIEDFNGDMLLSARAEYTENRRIFARYIDDVGEYVRLPAAQALDNESAQGGLARGENRFDNATAKIVYCGNTYGAKDQPANTRRTGLTIGVSYDAMRTWLSYNVPELDLSHTGYCNVEFLDENHLFCVYEGDNTTIKYAIIPLTNIIHQGE